MSYYGWSPYVPVAQRKRQAAQEMAKRRKRGVDIQPVEIAGRKIAKTFWGEAWCEHIESFGDYANRLPRGKRYVRNGSVCHLATSKRKIVAHVSGSEIYDVNITIDTLSGAKWRSIKKKCAGQIGSLVELLKGNFSDSVMEIVTDRKSGLFPQPKEIRFECDCPDGAGMCKHIAAVMYGVGARLDANPTLLFEIRGVDYNELIDVEADIATGGGASRRLSEEDLSSVFGIELDDAPSEPKTAKKPTKKSTARRTKAKPAKAAKGAAGRKAAVKKRAPKSTKTSGKKGVAAKEKVARKKSA